MAQQYSDFELIIVNDCSPEDLDEVISIFNDQRIHYYKNTTNYGAIDVVDNWNKCLSLSHGDYVICMGDDDRLMPNCLINYNNHIQNYPGHNIYHIRTEVINESGEIIDLQESRPLIESSYSMLWHRLAKGRIQFIGDFLFQRNSLIQHGGFYKLPYACYSDDISAYIAAQEGGIVNIDTPGFQYRRNSQTITNTQDFKIVVTSVQRAIKWMRSFLEDIPTSESDALYRILSLNLLRNHERDVYNYCFESDLRNKGRNLMFWWKHRTMYGISKRHFYNVLLKIVKRRF